MCVQVRYHPVSKTIEVKILEGRGIRGWSSSNKPLTGELSCEMILLPRPQSKSERKKLRQLTQIAKPVRSRSALCLPTPALSNLPTPYLFPSLFRYNR